ncbi:hypothetical protein CVT25_011949 [Psilocybe cyanescens]|uniref:F-box domain-containing protein n=1 Tax=Psilocybe cyanescens TaxID=93625 RepID=A0A409XQT9_PSICY|nr:hypothetical protein CVT25_011949 [Psilocybe cyanescens]
MCKPMCTGVDDIDLMSQMPPELLGEIFSYASSLDPDVPLVIGEVSALFRRIVRTTPQAWCRLQLLLSVAQSDSPEDADASCIRKTELWFAMARVLPVDVAVEISSFQGASSDGARNHTHIPILRGYGYGYYRRQETMKDGLSQEMNVDFTDLLLPHVLRNFNRRIRALELHTTTVNEAQAFLSALYPTASISFAGHELKIDAKAEEEYPLKSLTLHASSDGSRHVPHQNRSHLRGSSPTPSSAQSSFSSSRRGTCTTTSAGALILPRLPHLSHLKFHNHPLPPLVHENVRNLCALSVHYPLRFAPIPVHALLEVLGSARRLERLEVEARVVDDLSSSSSNSVVSAVALPAASTQHENSVASPVAPSSSPSDHHQQFSWDTAPHPSSSSHSSPSSQNSTAQTQTQMHAHPTPILLPLPHLTHLHLRINNLPAVLSQLLLPALRTLSVDDLDGKRAGAARQTGEVVRGLLVRMEMPLALEETEGEEADETKETWLRKAKGKETDTEGRGRGLEVLDMCSVALPSVDGDDRASHSHAHSYSSPLGGAQTQTQTHTAQTEAEAAEAVWAWCFRRMRTLREMWVKKMDVDALFALVTPHTNATWCGRNIEEEEKEDIPLPALKKLVVVEQDTYHPRSSAGLRRMTAHGHGSAFTASLSSSSLSPLTSSSPLESTSSLPASTASPSTQIQHPYPHPHRGALVKFQLRRPDVEVVYDAVLDSTAHHPSPVSAELMFWNEFSFPLPLLFLSVDDLTSAVGLEP